MADVDLLVIGGGINGCGVARDAVGRGYSVLLAEKADLASGTSSASTKLIHGGLRYLEHYEFRLVREALQEREVLWRMAPHIIWPLRFVLPHHDGLRPSWLLRLGLFLYDNLGGRKLLPATKTLDLRSHAAGKPLKGNYRKAFEYSDCWVQDSRLVALNARDAADRGATVLTRTAVTSAVREGKEWVVTLTDVDNGTTRTVSARMVINAAGPWVDQVLTKAVGNNDARNVRLVQGSHIVVPRLYEHDRCYIFQNADNRIIFAIPYEGDFTLIGTTDQDYKGDPANVKITESETNYLIDAANEYFSRQLTPSDVVWTYSGVRPLFDDGASKAQEATRDYVLKRDGAPDMAPLVNVFGGKITTYRRLAESVLELVEAELGAKGGSWSGTLPLPGGDFPETGFATLVENTIRAFPHIQKSTIHRICRNQGTKVREILGNARSDADLGRTFGAGLTESEVRYFCDREWVRSAGDLLWRRTKLGLRVSAEAAGELDEFIRNYVSDQELDRKRA